MQVYMLACKSMTQVFLYRLSEGVHGGTGVLMDILIKD